MLDRTSDLRRRAEKKLLKQSGYVIISLLAICRVQSTSLEFVRLSLRCRMKNFARRSGNSKHHAKSILNAKREVKLSNNI